MVLASRDELFLPEADYLHNCSCIVGESDDIRLGAQISSWLEKKTAEMRRIWVGDSARPIEGSISDPEICVERILDILTHPKFNHQSRGKVAHLFPALRRRLQETIQTNKPITFFLLFNGGYRAAPLPDRLDLIFQPDQTELFLLYQVALLQHRITAFYEPGIDFVIVVNNGVSRWVNDISRCLTEAYVGQLRGLVHKAGATDRIRVLCQSELPGYKDTWDARGIIPKSTITDIEHRIVERFLGRPCDQDEARFRNALYLPAEALWAETLHPFAEAQNAILLRQVAHPASLSFRPFPGGAIRTQNGTLGFLFRNGVPIPKLITACSFVQYRVRPVILKLPVSLFSESPVGPDRC